MAATFNFSARTRVLFGAGKLSELGDQELPGTRALVVTTGGKSVKANGYLARVEAEPVTVVSVTVVSAPAVDVCWTGRHRTVILTCRWRWTMIRSAR